MADLSSVEREINALPAAMRPSLLRIFQAVLRDLRFGHPDGDVSNASTNFSGGFLTATTPAIASTEFSILHGFDRAPYLGIPVLLLDTVGARTVPLEVTRAADNKRIYLKSTVASAPIGMFFEG